MLEYGNNEQLLRQIAAATGGRFNPSPQAVFDAGGRSIRTTMESLAGPAGAGAAAESGRTGSAQVEGSRGSAAPRRARACRGSGRLEVS